MRKKWAVTSLCGTHRMFIGKPSGEMEGTTHRIHYLTREAADALVFARKRDAEKFAFAVASQNVLYHLGNVLVEPI